MTKLLGKMFYDIGPWCRPG